MRTKTLESFCISSVFAALICIIAPFSLSFGQAVPLSLATLVIYVAAGMLDTKEAFFSVLIYILLGAAGLPVFSSFSGGVSKIAGVTGGFIIGYIPLAVTESAICSKFSGRWVYPVSMTLATVVLYSFGLIWFIIQTGSAFSSALAVCVLPFLLGDTIKIAAASIILSALKKRF